MNYGGTVTDVIPTMWTFQLDHKLTVHMGILASQSQEAAMPKIGEYVEIYNAHYLINKMNLEALFLCKKSKIRCSNVETSTFGNELLSAISRHHLGCTDVKAVFDNLEIIATKLKNFTSNTANQIMCNVIDVITCGKTITNSHSCLNTVLAPFRLKTVSHYRFINSDLHKPEKTPPWSFGSHLKVDESDRLIGCLKVSKQYGVILLHDTQHSIVCIFTNKANLDLYDFINRLVVINSFHIFTETYREANVGSNECILVDVAEMLVLDKINLNDVENVRDVLVRELPQSTLYVYSFRFQLLAKGMVTINRNGQIECWLEVFVIDRNENIYLGLNAHQVQIVPFLLTGAIYQVYHSQELLTQSIIELARIKKLHTRKFQEHAAVFVQISSTTTTNSALSVAEVMEKIKCSNESISFIGTLQWKSLVPPLPSRTTQLKVALPQFGTPGSYTHTLSFQENELRLVLYLNNWENLLIPFGLVPGMRVCIKNVLPQSKKYLKSTALTNFDFLNYEPPVFFDTVNLCKDVQMGDKYSYLGWGKLMPAGVLIWAHVSNIFIRSMRMVSECEDHCGCPSVDSCISVTITLYTHDEMGASLVISRSLEMLRLLIGLEFSQWKIWCAAFKTVKKYTYNAFEGVRVNNNDRRLFCDSLTLIIQSINEFQMVELDLKCRKIDEDEKYDSDGIPLWFCVDAKQKYFKM